MMMLSSENLLLIFPSCDETAAVVRDMDVITNPIVKDDAPKRSESKKVK